MCAEQVRVRTVKMATEEGGDIDVFGMSPWTPETAPSPIMMPAMRNPREIFLSSEEYIAMLESKLKKITAKSNKIPSSKEMIKSLAESKESRMKTLTDESSDPYISNHDFVAEDQESRLAAIQRRLHPERQAMNPEERKYLVDNDELGKMVLEMKSEDQEHAEQEWKRRLSHPNIHPKHSSSTPEEDDGAGDPTGDPPGQGEAATPGEKVPPGDESHDKHPDSDPPQAEAADESPGEESDANKEGSAVETKEENTAENTELGSEEAKIEDKKSEAV